MAVSGVVEKLPPAMPDPFWQTPIAVHGQEDKFEKRTPPELRSRLPLQAVGGLNVASSVTSLKELTGVYPVRMQRRHDNPAQFIACQR